MQKTLLTPEASTPILFIKDRRRNDFGKDKRSKYPDHRPTGLSMEPQLETDSTNIPDENEEANLFDSNTTYNLKILSRWICPNILTRRGDPSVSTVRNGDTLGLNAPSEYTKYQ